VGELANPGGGSVMEIIIIAALALIFLVLSGPREDES
jgi:hypothetical protein